MSACFSSLMSAGILDRVCARVCVHVRACVYAWINMTEGLYSCVHMCKSSTTDLPCAVSDILCQTPTAVIELSCTLTVVLSGSIHFPFVAVKTKGREQSKSARHKIAFRKRIVAF